MTWFAHRCWFCGHKHKQVDFLGSEPGGKWQCKFELRDECEQRRKDKGIIGIDRADRKIAKKMGWWSE